jgi:xylulokinase
MKFREKYPEAYKATGRISLVSAFLASVFLGKVASIDVSDVGGMNLWDIKNEKWHDDLLALAAGDAGAEDLRNKLGPLALDGGASFGPISPYFVSRYGFDKSCCVIPMTGDNPSTILALPLHASDAIVSLGTSTTFLMSTPQYKPDPSYHFMSHPTTPGLYMFMLCYKNGSLAREQMRDAVNATKATDKNSKAWETYNAVATASPVLGQANPSSDPIRMGLFFPRPEIVPNVKAGTWRFLYDAASGSLAPVQPDADTNNNGSSSSSSEWPQPDADARAILESQYLSLRLRSQALVTPQKTADGAPLPPQPRRVYLVGGGSANAAFADLAGQVLGGAEGVFKLDIGGNACALGGAYKACWGVERSKGETFEDFLDKRWNEEEFVKKVAEGYREGVWERYGKALEGFDRMEKLVLKEAGAEGA